MTNSYIPVLILILMHCRQARPVAAFEEHSDYISSFWVAAAEQCLLATSADGTLSVTDLRTNKVR